MGVVTSLASCLPLAVCSLSLPVILWEMAISSLLAKFGVSYVTVRPLLGKIETDSIFNVAPFGTLQSKVNSTDEFPTQLLVSNTT